MQENHVPNASIPPSNQPTNSPEPHKSNTGLIIAIVLIVVAFGLQFIAPFFMMFMLTSSFSDLIDDFGDGWEWTYDEEEYDAPGSADYSGDWSGDGLFLTFNTNAYYWNEMVDEENSIYESGKYIATAADGALKHVQITEEEAAKLLGREEEFNLKNLYAIELMVTERDEDTSDEVAMSHRILFYHLNYYHAKVYDMATQKSYDLTWIEPQMNERGTPNQEQGNRA